MAEFLSSSRAFQDPGCRSTKWAGKSIFACGTKGCYFWCLGSRHDYEFLSPLPPPPSPPYFTLFFFWYCFFRSWGKRWQQSTFLVRLMNDRTDGLANKSEATKRDQTHFVLCSYEIPQRLLWSSTVDLSLHPYSLCETLGVGVGRAK